MAEYYNRLADEKSPFLLRHAGNLVDWYPWCGEAFERAVRDNKPIFLSIGYSSCHWCHTMERECFCDVETAGLLNDACVSVLVDREERPDLDALFMEVCQIQNGSGGWPLNLFLTPQGEPFFAATFLPKRTTGRMPGLADITPRVKWLWLMQKDDVLRGARNLAENAASRSDFALGGQINSFHQKMLMKELKNIFDAAWGGFGQAPKFPCAPRLLFFLEYARANPSEKDELLGMVSLTLRKMWAGGIHDHLGGGYARYATDERWHVPHFEKMLYDQAMLLWVAAAAYEAEQDVFYQKFAEDTALCVLRDFLSPEACFWSSIDADNGGDEGSFYRWTEDEIRAALPQGDAGIFCAAYAVMPGGNFAHEMTRRQMGHNVLYEAAPVTELARRYGLRAPDLTKRLENDRRFLFEARNKRPRPPVDDKVLMDWNGLTIGALAYAGRVFDKKEWILAAERAAMFLQKALPDPKGSWRRRYRGKEAGIPALPGDYAALIWGVMQLHRCAESDRQKRDWFRYAETLAEKLEENFLDGEKGGFFLSPADEGHIFLRRKSAEDDAMPSVSAMAMMAYAELGRAPFSRAPSAPDDKGEPDAAPASASPDRGRRAERAARRAERERGEERAEHPERTEHSERGERDEKAARTDYVEKGRAAGACFARRSNMSPLEHVSIYTAHLMLTAAKEAREEAEAAREKEKKEREKEREKEDGAEQERRRAESAGDLRDRRSLRDRNARDDKEPDGGKSKDGENAVTDRPLSTARYGRRR